jgi:hypothetical protein
LRSRKPIALRCCTARTLGTARRMSVLTTRMSTTPRLGRGAQVLSEPHSTPDGVQRGYSPRDREGQHLDLCGSALRKLSSSYRLLGLPGGGLRLVTAPATERHPYNGGSVRLVPCTESSDWHAVFGQLQTWPFLCGAEAPSASDLRGWLAAARACGTGRGASSSRRIGLRASPRPSR